MGGNFDADFPQVLQRLDDLLECHDLCKDGFGTLGPALSRSQLQGDGYRMKVKPLVGCVALELPKIGDRAWLLVPLMMAWSSGGELTMLYLALAILQNNH